MGYSPNIRYGIIGRNLLESHMSFEEATVVFVVTKQLSDEEICRYARFLIDRGVRDYAFCGVDSKHWHSLFDITDVDIKQDNDDYSNTWIILWILLEIKIKEKIFLKENEKWSEKRVCKGWRHLLTAMIQCDHTVGSPARGERQ
ncbi:MAG: hypothetical protein IKM88_01425 [Lachnospiraceae bacterium]|nr:hypothetical protein [Lachnospiraceae bacterium]